MCITKEQVYYKDLRRLIELMSKDIVEMSIFWQLNSITGDDELGYPSLSGMLKFVNDSMEHINVDEHGIIPVKDKGFIDYESMDSIDWNWKFALLYDVCKARVLCKLNDKEGDYHIEPAYTEGRFIGWEVKFFNTAEEVEQFIKDNPDFDFYSLYTRRRKLPFKFGYYDGSKKIYCTQTTYNNKTNTFIEVDNLYKITVQGAVDYVIAEDEDYLARCCGLMVKEFETDNIAYYWCPVVIETRHKTLNANVYTFRPEEYKFSLEYENVEVPIEEKATLCWQYCAAYMDYQIGERVKDEDLCPSCPIRDFQSVLDGLYPDDVDPTTMQDIREHCVAPTKCDFCDLTDLTSENYACGGACDTNKRKELLQRGQIRIIDNYEIVKSEE